ncbi:antitoxin ParD1/3/4 [Hoeflea marina]|uniref:Antitoxin ParD1/3/4 n=1 Tax=Hoeflea marina TaxID=274592 RepID=A0A317PQD9_9HYPH|nr:type II toxin-antitoxin system ParD family antitoxin [Hoeflea marina]PWW03673.1 antitoxin ParD1/3/4 [Hoeflea marina]
MATMNVSLPAAMKAWVERQSADGRYSNASDYVRDLIRQDQERKGALDILQTAITEGIESGESQRFDPNAFKRRMRSGHAAE